jgi:hypothetical protein
MVITDKGCKVNAVRGGIFIFFSQIKAVFRSNCKPAFFLVSVKTQGTIIDNGWRRGLNYSAKDGNTPLL